MTTAGEGAAKANRGPAAGPENRAALLRAAREVFAESGLGAPLSAVAKRAGVGQGSLYRHFPTRTALAAAVFEENVDALEVATADADRTIDDLFDGIVEQAVASTALIELVAGSRDDASVAALGARFTRVVATLIERERAAGHVGEHIATEDVLLAAGMLATELARTPPEDRPETARRIRQLFRSGFAPR